MEDYDHKDRNIEYLLRKYETKQPGECWSKEYETAAKKEYRLNKKINQAQAIGNRLYLTRNQIDRVVYIIKKIDN